MDYSASEAPMDEDFENSSDEESGSSDEDVESGEEEDDDDEDGSEDDEDESNEQLGESVDNYPSASGSDGDQERECCPICLNKFRGQELGTPESCEHTFCFECIQEWSKNINTCPVDRTEFNFIRVRDAPGGRDLKRVRVKVLPKEPEDAIQEGVTLCEICHNGDREDRLLLCDGCDLAYHCECLDPPLFYIPIEEWFCNSCSGVIQNRAIAGPSTSRIRRVIPRTRASEAVRSRVRNLRTTPSSASRSISSNNRSTAKCTPKKRRRRRYRRTYKKVVQLARTKGSVSSNGKSKVAARGATVVVTYRRARRKRRSKLKRLSKKSLASSKSLPVPSAQQRIAKRLGISKPPTGSAIPQVKQPSGSHSVTRTAKMPSHSLFGNKNQLMDFSENFNEDLVNVSRPSTSSSLGRRISEDSQSSSTSSVNILDSIMAGQKLLHSKSKNIVIKTDGSLVLKESDANKIKTTNTIKTPAITQSSHTPMSIALAKEGVRSLVLPSGKKSSFSLNVSNTSKTKNVQPNDIIKPCSSDKVSSKTKNETSQPKLRVNSGSSMLHSELTKNVNVYFNEQNKKGALSSWKIPKKNKEKVIKDEECATTSMQDMISLPERSERHIHPNLKSKLPHKFNDTVVKNEVLNIAINKKEIEENTDLPPENSSRRILSKCSTFIKKQSGNNLISPVSSSNHVQKKNSHKIHVKNEIMSDEETNSESISQELQPIHIKQENVSDEETNMDCWAKTTNKLQISKTDCESLTNEKGDSDSGSETSASDGINNDMQLGNYASDSEDLDFDASQSIIDSVSYDSTDRAQHKKSNFKVPDIKIKEESPSDAEDYSQSIVSDSVSHFEPEPVISHSNSSGKSPTKHVTKTSELNSESVESRFLNKSKILSKNLLQEDDLPCTQLALHPVASHTQNVLFSSNSSSPLHQKSVKLPEQSSMKETCNKEMENLFSSDEEFPATQLNFKYNQPPRLSTSVNQTSSGCEKFENLPETQVNSSVNKLSALPATQLFNEPSKGITNLSNAELLSSDDESNTIPATQVFNTVYEDIVNSSVTECLPPADNTLPATQVWNADPNVSTNPSNLNNSSFINESNTFPGTQIFNDTLKELPATQVCDTFTNMTTNPCCAFNDASKDIIDLPNTQVSVVDNNSADLPATQIFNVGLSKSSQACNENTSKLLSSNKLISNMTSCSNDEEKESGTNINDIISNIKQVVNSYICRKNPNSSCLSSNSQTNSEESANLKPCANDNSLESNLNCNDKSSEMSSSLNNGDINENIIAKCSENPCNDESAEGSENQHSSTESESEELTHEKLKEMINKSTKVDSPKKVGVHRHLPQVITIKPVKGQPRPKLPNRRTFSFEEVAKLEESNTATNSKPGEDRIFENSASDSNEADQDSIPSTQKADDTFNVYSKVSSTEPAFVKDNLPETQAISFPAHVENWDLPMTQAASWQNNGIDVPDTQAVTANEAEQEEDLFVNQKIKNVLNDSDIDIEKNAYLKKSKKTVKFCTIKTNAPFESQRKKKTISSKSNTVHHDVCESVDVTDTADLPATQMFNGNHSILTNEKVNQQCNSSEGNNKMQSNISSTFKFKDKVSDKAHKTPNSEAKKITNYCNNGSKRSNDDESRDKNAKKFKDSVGISYENFKENQNSNMPKVSDHHKSKLFCEKSVPENNSSKKINEENNSLNEVPKINIKQEKSDAFDFKTPLPVINKTSEPSVKSFSVHKIKSENTFEEDFLPPTQPVVFNFFENLDLPPTQVVNFDDDNSRNLLSSTNIKKEVLSDDEISVIELDLSSDIKVKKEIITIDDDDDGLTNSNVQIRDEIVLMSDNKIENSEVKVKKEKKNDYDITSNASQTSISNSLNHVNTKSVTIKVEKGVTYNKSNMKKIDSSLKTKNVYSKSKSGSKDTEAISKHVGAPQVSQKGESKDTKATSKHDAPLVSQKGENRSNIYENRAIHSKSKTRECENGGKCNRECENGVKRKASKDSFLLEESKHSRHENKKLKIKDIKYGSTDKEKHTSSKNSCLDEQNKQKKHDTEFLKFKSTNSRGSYKDTGKCKSATESSLKGKNEDKNFKESLNSKSKDPKRDYKDSKHQKMPKDLSSLKEGIKQREHDTNSSDSKVRCGIVNSKDGSFKEQTYRRHDNETLKSKSINSNLKNESKVSSKEHIHNLDIHDEISNNSLSSRHTRNSSEKENNSSSKTKDRIITLKPTCRKRPHEAIESRCEVKKQKYEEMLHSEPCTGEDVSQLSPVVHNGSFEDSNSTTKLETNCDTDNDSISNCAVESLLNKDLIRMSKQELKEEIANEVKMILKPFFSTGLISKDDYKDIMRRAVPKIFVNCHNTINPEKIRKLILSYVSLLNKS